MYGRYTEEELVKIGLISDTHGSVPAWKAAIRIFDGADLILHAGDVLYHPPRLGCTPGYDIPGSAELINSCPIPMIIARGNCDAEVYEELLEIPVMSPYALAQVSGLRIIIQHGHNLAGRMDLLAEKYRADMIVTGHTHLPVIERIGKTLHVNPGSPSHPKLERDGRLVPTVGMICDNKALILDLETGEPIQSMALTELA
jgi:uncharacterized protein